MKIKLFPAPVQEISKQEQQYRRKKKQNTVDQNQMPKGTAHFFFMFFSPKTLQGGSNPVITQKILTTGFAVVGT